MFPRHTHILTVVFLALAGCSSSSSHPQSASASKTLMINVETGELVAVDPPSSAAAGDAATTPASPSTLRPALYCTTCQKWYPAPLVEQLHRQRGVAYCPKDGKSLTANGPWPAELGAANSSP